jgi:hypothetical protein
LSVADYVPLSRRLSGKEQVLHPGVPPHLEPPLTEWITKYEAHRVLRDAALRAEIWYAPTGTDHQVLRMHALMKGIHGAADPPKAFLDVVEGILFIRSQGAANETYEKSRVERVALAKKSADSLDEILRLGGSHWHVQGDHLEARVDDSVREAFDLARQESSRSSASTHLQNAWIACYGRNPSPGTTYSESIKAVEAAAAPVISPKNLKATLGTMLGELRPNAGQWRFTIAPGAIDPVLSAMSALWEGQTDRHGGVLTTVPITSDAAQAAVLLAATLVHWFATGAVKRR